jgi:hypothetical protein
MIFAARKLQGIGLIVLLTICALIVYPVSLQVSSTRSKLHEVEQQIAELRLSNRKIEGDIAVVANVVQLDKWNREMIGYAAPVPGQYLSGERAIASVERLHPLDSLIAAQRVLVAAAQPGDAASAVNRARENGRSDGGQRTVIAEVASASLSSIPDGALR